MSTTLDDLLRIHDDEPARVADALLTIDAGALDDAQQRTYGFLLNHVLGERFGRWSEALIRLTPLAERPQASLRVLRHHGVAALQAGDHARCAQAQAQIATAAAVEPAVARALLQVAALGLTPLTTGHAPQVAALALQASAFAPGALDADFAACFNNVTTALYYATREVDVTGAPGAPMRSALRRGAEAALLFWRRAGGWMEHERALYLRAKIALRTAEPVAALAHAEQGLAIVEANGSDAVERAFLLQLQAAALERAGQPGRAAAVRDAVAALQGSLDADLRKLLADDAAEFPSPPRLRVGFVGGGNMAHALLGGLQRAGVLAAAHVIELDAARRRELEQTFAATTAAAPDAALAGCDVIVLAVKPQQMRAACEALAPHLGDAVVLSIAAGIRARDLARWLGTERIVRAMPNTPALIGQGISGVAALPALGDAQRALAAQVLAAAGDVVWVADESLLDPVTALSGSGPAYVFRFIEALQAGGTALGLPAADARRLAIGTVTGAGQLAAQSSESVATLRERVTSKGGTTAAALGVMETQALEATVVAAMRAADARAREMGDEFGAQ